jgi:hypothetical protein
VHKKNTRAAHPLYPAFTFKMRIGAAIASRGDLLREISGLIFLSPSNNSHRAAHANKLLDKGRSMLSEMHERVGESSR